MPKKEAVPSGPRVSPQASPDVVERMQGRIDEQEREIQRLAQQVSRLSSICDQMKRSRDEQSQRAERLWELYDRSREEFEKRVELHERYEESKELRSAAEFELAQVKGSRSYRAVAAADRALKRWGLRDSGPAAADLGGLDSQPGVSSAPSPQADETHEPPTPIILREEARPTTELPSAPLIHSETEGDTLDLRQLQSVGDGDFEFAENGQSAICRLDGEQRRAELSLSRRFFKPGENVEYKLKFWLQDSNDSGWRVITQFHHAWPLPPEISEELDPESLWRFYPLGFSGGTSSPPLFLANNSGNFVMKSSVHADTPPLEAHSPEDLLKRPIRRIATEPAEIFQTRIAPIRTECWYSLTMQIHWSQDAGRCDVRLETDSETYSASHSHPNLCNEIGNWWKFGAYRGVSTGPYEIRIRDASFRVVRC